MRGEREVCIWACSRWLGGLHTIQRRRSAGISYFSSRHDNLAHTTGVTAHPCGAQPYPMSPHLTYCLAQRHIQRGRAYERHLAWPHVVAPALRQECGPSCPALLAASAAPPAPAAWRKTCHAPDPLATCIRLHLFTGTPAHADGLQPRHPATGRDAPMIATPSGEVLRHGGPPVCALDPRTRAPAKLRVSSTQRPSYAPSQLIKSAATPGDAMRALPVFLLLAGACNETKLTTVNRNPEAVILSPEDGRGARRLRLHHHGRGQRPGRRRHRSDLQLYAGRRRDLRRPCRRRDRPGVLRRHRARRRLRRRTHPHGAGCPRRHRLRHGDADRGALGRARGDHHLTGGGRCVLQRPADHLQRHRERRRGRPGRPARDLGDRDGGRSDGDRRRPRQQRHDHRLRKPATGPARAQRPGHGHHREVRHSERHHHRRSRQQPPAARSGSRRQCVRRARHDPHARGLATDADVPSDN